MRTKAKLTLPPRQTKSRRLATRAVISSLSVHWYVPQVRGLELSAQVENLWDCAFEEVPAVPAAPRQYSFGLAYRW